MSEKWDWTSEEVKQDLIVPSVRAVAVYRNGNNEVVIRQQSLYGEDDSFVILPETFLGDLISALQEEISPDMQPGK